MIRTLDETKTIAEEDSNVSKPNILDTIKLDKALRLAKQKSKDGQFEEAKAIYEDIIQKFTKNKQALIGLQSLVRGVTAAPQDPPPEQLQLIINYYTQGQLQQALSDISQMLERFPNSAVLYNIAGAANVGLMRFDASIDSFQQALKINPNNAEVYNNMGNALMAKGDLDAAVDSFKQGLKIQPNNAQIYNNLGVALNDKGDPESALGSYKQAIKIKPDYDEAYYNMGIALQKKGERGAAINSYRQALKIRPDYVDAYYNMAVALQSKGDLEAAIDSFKQALEIKPDYAEAYYNMGSALNDKGDSEAAIDSYKQALKIKPDNAEAYYNIGVALQDKDDPEGAIDSYEQALKINPDFAEAYNNMGNALKTKGDPEAAINNYLQALKIKPNYADAYNNMGLALQDKCDPEAAIDSYKQALKINPKFAEAYNNMGNALKDKGDSAGAIDSFKQALKIKPDSAVAYSHFSDLNSYKEHDEHFIKMQSLCMDPSTTDEDRCNLSFSLSKASEDLNEMSQSFNYLKMGNQLRKKILSYNVKQDIALFSQLKKSYPSIAKLALQSTGETGELKPIFILGMPRSGTTLVEQIVSSHSEVAGAGELTYVERFGQSIAKGVIGPNTEIILDFRQRYIEALKKRSDARSIVTDKMPQNFLYIGLIFSAFPDAKVIHVNRDPAATCWSNYKHYFVAKGLGYSYDLDDVVTYFGLYKDLMQFWQGHYGGRIFDLNYDNLTINQEDETRKLIQYLELEWEDECLSPQRNKRSVRTASQQQVRQKVYQGSSQQWRKFEPYLNGAFDKLTGLS
jgi:tetratricopeptide (TPR) repeat protein